MVGRRIWGMGRLFLPWLVMGCLQTTDLRSNTGGDPGLPGDAACGQGERIDPDTGGCAPCVRREPHPSAACPCGWEYRAAPFPFCDDPRATYDCDQVCRGEIGVCNAYAPSDGSIRSCTQLAQCCHRLAQDPGSTPCCSPEETLLCFPAEGGTWDYELECEGPTCCAIDCTDDDDCDPSFQACEFGKCIPDCDPDTEYCIDNGSECECQLRVIP